MKSGFFLIDKPVDITSFDIIRKLRKITHIKKMGHTGTLDPFATGLMIIAFGNATRTLSLLEKADKTYLAEMKFGIKTDTADFTGNVIAQNDNLPVFEPASLTKYVLSISTQIPSKFSAIKIDGKKAYELARENKSFTMKEKNVKILDFNIINYSYPILSYKASVSSGTYIRTLSEQIADYCSNIATTVSLKRTNINNLSLEKAVPLNELNEDYWKNYALNYSDLFPDFTIINLPYELENKYLNGMTINSNQELPNDAKILVYNADNSVCLGFSQSINQQLKPLIIFNNHE
jgi:tRNA pseudouridine55 synthase